MIAHALALLLLDPSGPATHGVDQASVSLTPPVALSTPILASVAVALECVADADGRIETCTVLEETHPGLGFGAAAIALIRDAGVEPSGARCRVVRTIQFTP